ncbi:MAG: anthranilate synthase component I family protein [Bacteroidota bacterium]
MLERQILVSLSFLFLLFPLISKRSILSMPKKKQDFNPLDLDSFSCKADHWANQHNYFCSLHSSRSTIPYGSFPRIIAVGANTVLAPQVANNFKALEQYLRYNKDWLFGHFSYDLKNETENLTSENKSQVIFPQMTFFRPDHLIHFNTSTITIESEEEPGDIYNQIRNFPLPLASELESHQLRADTTETQYMDTVEKLRKHIEEGDIYEINYCINFYAKYEHIDPVYLFHKLTELSPNPFSAFYKLGEKYALCASPERFIKKIKHKIVSQPIKGTAPRGSSDPNDLVLKNNLQSSEKERAENMMIVDLVRNDLARSCLAGSVKVEEMFGIYTFPQLHQMISTISGELRDDKTPVDAIKNAFPMGSMTGAPKIKVMELIERYEQTARGLFSGSIGYFKPDNDFDFNVMIRSLFLDAKKQKLSFSVGSAITFDSDPAEEYAECKLKAKAIKSLITAKNNN